MKFSIDVKNTREGEAIKRALEDDELRAFVLVVGLLKPFTDRARARILAFVGDAVTDPHPALRAEDEVVEPRMDR